MTSLTGNRIYMSVDPVILMYRFDVAVCTIHLVGAIYANRHRTSLDQMIGRLVAIDTLKIVASHVYVDCFRGKVQTAVQITMLDSIAAAAVKMATSTIGPCGHANALGDRGQIDVFIRKTRIAFYISA
jgi:hypothetical protein